MNQQTWLMKMLLWHKCYMIKNEYPLATSKEKRSKKFLIHLYLVVSKLSNLRKSSIQLTFNIDLKFLFAI